MAWYSFAAIYLLVWVLTLFTVLPHGVRTSREMGAEDVPGQAPSAPHDPAIGRKLVWTTLISSVLMALFMLNWHQNWLTRADLDALLPGSGRSLPKAP